ncbi:MAG TPA: DciA family protein, partial [Actinotalea sp.]|nr:DciA family protein [Actinotalea sp.]
MSAEPRDPDRPEGPVRADAAHRSPDGGAQDVPVGLPAAEDRPAPMVDPSRPVAEQLGLTPASEVARAALNRAKAAARARGLRPGQTGQRRASPEVRSGPGRDGRDPTLVGDTLARLAGERGWSAELSVGGVIGRWREVVGDQVAEHCVPETFEDGVLVVRADSTAWATNLTLLVPQLLARLETELGRDVVRKVAVQGPAGPRWVKGPR